jgi:hypothetical protein
MSRRITTLGIGPYYPPSERLSLWRRGDPGIAIFIS